MELNDIIHLSLFYRNKKGLKNFTPEEVISIGYQSYLTTEKLYNSQSGTKKSTYFMQILEWNFREEFRKTSQVKIPKAAWNNGTRTSVSNLNKKEYEVSRIIEHNCFYDDYEILYKALEELPERYKFILAHKYELKGKEKLSFKAIAERMNLSPQRVRILHINGLKKVKDIIKSKEQINKSLDS